MTPLLPPSFYRNDFAVVGDCGCWGITVEGNIRNLGIYNRKGKTEDEEGKHVVPKSYVVARRIILFSSVSLPTPCGYRRRPGILNCSDINIMQ